MVKLSLGLAVLAGSVVATAGATYFATKSALTPVASVAVTATCPDPVPAPVHDPAIDRFNAAPRVPVTGHKTW